MNGPRKCQKAVTITDDERNDSVDIVVTEFLNPEFCMFLWPSSYLLAEYIWRHKDSFYQSRILELGSGVGLPGLVALKCGAYVTLSDATKNAHCLRNLEEECMLNNVRATSVLGLDWGHFTDKLLCLAPFDIVIGSDCLYEKANYDDLLSTVVFFLQQNPNAKFLTTYHQRRSHFSFEYHFLKWGLKYRIITEEWMKSSSVSEGGCQIWLVNVSLNDN